MSDSLPFPPKPKARGNLQPGTVYAVDGGDGYIYYTQVDAQKRFGFVRYRSKTVNLEVALDADLMCRMGVSFPSVGRATRSGAWLNLGRHGMHEALQDAPIQIQWPVGTTTVTLWQHGEVQRAIEVHDPSIQALEVMSVFDASDDVPDRITAEYAADIEKLSIHGGRVIDHRRRKERFAKQFPDMPWHQLPIDWMFVEDDG